MIENFKRETVYSKKNSIFLKFIPWLFIISLIFNYYLRSSVLPSFVAYFNLLLITTILIYILMNIKKINIRIIVILILILLIITSNNTTTYGTVTTIETLQSVLYLIFPLIIFCINIDEFEYLDFLYKFLKIFNRFMFFIFFLMIIDFFSTGEFFRQYSNFFPDFYPFYQKNTQGIVRYPSILGHQLITKTFFLLYFSLNFAYGKITQRYISNPILVICISVIAITLTGSKSGIVLLFVLIAYLNMKSRNFIILITVIIGTILLYYIGIFDSLLSRFLNTSLTTGRLEAWNQINYLLPPIKWFSGYGDLFFNNLKYFIKDYVITAAFEFPFITLIYMYGIIFTIFFYSIVFLSIILAAMRLEDKTILVAYLIFFVDINTYNQIVFNPDMVGLIILINFIFYTLIKSSNLKGDNLKI